MWGYLLLLLSLQKKCYFFTFLGERRYARSGRRERDTCDGREARKRRNFSAPILSCFPPSRVSRAPRPFVLNSVKKASVFQATLFSKSVGKILWCLSTSSESSLIELLHITIYLCFRISEQTWIWFFPEFFLWSLLLSSDRGLQDLRDLGVSLPLININPLTMLSTKY